MCEFTILADLVLTSNRSATADVLEIVAVIVVASAATVLLFLLPKIKDTFLWSISGEPGSLMPRGMMIHAARLRRATELQTVLSHLALITRLNLPLGPALEAAARGEVGRVAVTLRTLGRLLDSGAPISQAVDQSIRGCPRQLVAILRRAEACGQQPAALARLQQWLADQIHAGLLSTAHVRHAVAYATLMLVIAASFVAWIMVFLLPRVREIFLDYEAPLPGVTVALIGTADWLAAYGPGILLLAIFFAFCAMLLCARACAARETGRVARWVAGLRWAIPFTRTVDYGLGMARAIRSMTLAIHTGAPASFVATLPSVVSPTNFLRGRLQQFSEFVSSGVSPYEAAGRAGLGDVFVAALKMVSRGESPERALDHAATYYEAIAYRWWHALVALSGPVVTLLLAILVGFIALALFMPLIALISAVSETI